MMANFQKTILLLPLFLLSASAHFTLNYPTTLGFNQNAEDESPCGGAVISFTNTTPFHVAGDAIAITTLHPQSNVLYRATNDGTGKGNWTVLALIAEYGLGGFCEPALKVPAAWVGQLGLLQIVQNAEDGIHYQCAAVNFVDGPSSSMPSACQNATGNSAAFVSDTTLLPASGTGTPTTPGPVSSATSSPSATTTKQSGAERSTRVGWWASMAGVLLMATLLL